MPGPYRDLAPSPTGAPPRTLSCWLRDGDRGRWIRSILVKLGFTATATMIASAADARAIAGLAALLGLFWASRDLAERKGAELTFEVEHGQLRVAWAGASRRFDFVDLLDVRLDTKSASKNVTMARADGVNTVFGMASNHNIALDLSRVQLIVADGDEAESIIPYRAFISHTLCADSVRTIKLFLRAHGWRPHDERE